MVSYLEFLAGAGLTVETIRLTNQRKNPERTRSQKNKLTGVEVRIRCLELLLSAFNGDWVMSEGNLRR